MYRTKLIKKRNCSLVISSPARDPLTFGTIASIENPSSQAPRDDRQAVTKKLINQLIGFFQYYYSSYRRNYYPYILVGEKQSSETLIVYKKLHHPLLIETPLRELLVNPLLIEGFKPMDALRIGFISLAQFILKIPDEKKSHEFNQIKNIMLNSTHDVTNNINFDSSVFAMHHGYSAANTKLRNKNTYSCRLVGTKGNEIKTKIVFTVLGKREGYDILLSKLINNIDLLNKFHPTEAIKFGFIYMGDVLLNSNDSLNMEK